MTSPVSNAQLTSWIAEARGRWPLIALNEADFGRHLARLGRSAPVFPVDTCLAAACAAGDAAALQALEDDFISRVADAIRRIDASPVFGAEVRQQLRIRLLVKADDAPCRIASYTGEVPLSAWMRVIALRLALNAKRASKSVRESESDGQEVVAMDDPEIDYLRGQYREPFVRSFERALGELSKDDRTILRLHYVDGVNIDGIGRIFQVHRATVARWLVRIRSDVLAAAKSLLAEQVGVDLDDADSVLGALAGDIDLTLSRVLAASAGKGSVRAQGFEPR